MSRSLLISNFILFQLGWFACVLGGAYQQPIAGSLIAIAIIAIHIVRAAIPKQELYLVLIALVLGFVFESVMTLAGINRYSSGIIITDFAPYWMVLLWGIFATTINVSMRWISALPLIWVGVAGAVMAPLSYLAGERMQAVEFSNTALALSGIALGWAVLLPLLVFTARFYNGYTDKTVATEEELRHV